MSLAFYMNEHVPNPITVGLRIRGVDVLTAQEDRRRETDDATLLDRAAALGRVMFSLDADMLREATRRQRQGHSFAGLVFAHPTRISVGECIRDLELIAKVGEPADMANQIEYLPL
jgi:hypothetical protein